MKILLPTIFVLCLGFATYSQSAVVIGEKTKLRSYPSEKGKVVKVLDKNAMVGVITRKGAWSLVRWHKAQGWLRASSINAVKEMRLDRITKLGSVDSDTGCRVVENVVFVGDQFDPPVLGLPKTISATSLPKPAYPAAARFIHAGGSVSVQVLIDESGEVVSANSISGHPLLRAAAVSAAQASTFSPTLLQGQPVKVSGVITYNFVP